MLERVSLANPQQVRGAPPKPGLAAALGLGTQMAVGMAFFAGIGYYADRRRGGGTAFTLAGVFLGLLYGGYEVWKVVRMLNEEERTAPRDAQR